MTVITTILLVFIIILTLSNLYILEIEKKSKQKNRMRAIRKHAEDALEQSRKANKKTLPETFEIEKIVEKQNEIKKMPTEKSKRLEALEAYLKQISFWDSPSKSRNESGHETKYMEL